MPLPFHRLALRVALVYIAVAGLWIALSDWGVKILVTDHDLMARVSMFKGWTFVAVTGALLYGMLRRSLQRLEREVAARTEIEEALRQWADAFVHCTHGMVIEQPATDRLLACNPAFARMLGRTVAEIGGSPWRAVHLPDDRTRVDAAISQADQAGSARYEAQMQREDGSAFPAQIDVVSVRDQAGTLRYRVATIQDITQRKAAETALRASEERLLVLVENLSEGLLVSTLAGELLHWNRAGLTMHGLASLGEGRRLLAEMEPVFELAALDGRVLALEEWPLSRILRGETLREVDLRVRRRDQEWVRIFRYGGAIAQEGGGPPLAFVTVTDITERKAAEAALRESEERFRAVVENIHEVFWMVDVRDRRMLYVSPSYATVWGRPPEELYANSMTWLEAIDPADRERVAAAAAAKQAAGTYDEQFQIVRPDGSRRWIRDQAFPVKNPRGEVERIVGIAEDVTERKNLEAQFLRAQRMEAIGTLAGGIAHDLNNILAPMLMAAGLLKDNTSDPRDREMLEMVERSAHRGADIIRQLLTFSRGVEGARMPLQPRHLLKEMSGIIRETFPRHITLVEKVAADLAPVVADATQLHQVLVNLCVNARDAMPEGGTLTITAGNVMLSAEEVQARPGVKAGPHVLIKVADTGSGMPPEIIERIFDPFFTTKDIGKGTGLGLSTVLGIVRSHQGFITVYSEVGSGSAFRVYLPAVPKTMADSATPFAEKLPHGGGELILVVDDEETIREAIQRVLESHNYRVLTARNGKEAVTAFLRQREEVNLVLTDVMMPEMGGAALVRSLRLLNSRIKIIATSGLEPEGKRGELAVLGVATILPKPCGPQELLNAIRTELNSGR